MCRCYENSYESVYARHYTNSTTMQYGYLNMVLPFITVIFTPLICSLADRRRAHRSYFTISLVITSISIALFALLPLVSDRPKRGGSNHSTKAGNNPGSSGLLTGPWVYYCINSLICNLAVGINTCLSDSFAVLQAEECKTSFGRVIVWGTFGWAASALVLSFINQWEASPRLLPGLVFGTALLTIDVIIAAFWERNADFKLDLIPIDAAKTLTGSSSSSHKEPMPLTESARINLGSVIDMRDGNKHRKTRSPVEIVQEMNTLDRQAASVDNSKKETDFGGGGASLKTISSEIGLESSSKKVLEEQSSNETLSCSLSAPNQKYLNKIDNSGIDRNTIVDYYNKDVNLKQQAIGKAIEIVHQKEESSKKEELSGCVTSLRMQILILCLILKRRKTLIRFLILFVLSGFFMSMHWNYFFLYLDQIYHDHFEFISAFSMITQSLLGELPIFILSRSFIDYFGQSHTLSISIITIGLRFLLYAYFLPHVNMYYIAIADAFQGPNYGLFYVVMTEVGLEFSYCDDATIEKLAEMGEINPNDKRQVDAIRLSLRSTIQSVAFACYEGIGVGIGSLVGGWLVACYGFDILWAFMAFGSILVGLVNIIVEILCKEHDPEGVDDERDSAEERREPYSTVILDTIKFEKKLSKSKDLSKKSNTKAKVAGNSQRSRSNKDKFKVKVESNKSEDRWRQKPN